MRYYFIVMIAIRNKKQYSSQKYAKQASKHKDAIGSIQTLTIVYGEDVVDYMKLPYDVRVRP